MDIDSESDSKSNSTPPDDFVSSVSDSEEVFVETSLDDDWALIKNMIHIAARDGKYFKYFKKNNTPRTK